MKYDELLNIWADKIFKKSDEINDKLNHLDPEEEYQYKHGRMVGYQEGLLMATSILSRLEQLHPEVKTQ